MQKRTIQDVPEKEEKFVSTLKFLRRGDLGELAEGWYELGEGVRASVQRYVTMDADSLSFETHEKFYDVQYVVEGREFIGVRSRKGLVAKGPYDEENDITFYEEPELSGRVLLEAGDYVVLVLRMPTSPGALQEKPCPWQRS